MISITTFNANNFFLRYKFKSSYPGGEKTMTAKIEAADAAALGYLPAQGFQNKLSSDYVIWDVARRSLAAKALREPDGQLPDVICFQEVENLSALRAFNELYLGKHYKYSMLIDGRDPRNIDVGLLSTLPIDHLVSHVDETAGSNSYVFSRDCLEATLVLPSGKTLTLFLNHLKSKYTEGKPGTPAYDKAVKSGNARRKAQAQRVADLVTQRFGAASSTALYAVVGDFNDTPQSDPISPLSGHPGLVDVVGGSFAVPEEAWTYYWKGKGRVSRIDYILASKALAKKLKSVHIERRGTGYREQGASGTNPRVVKFFELEDAAAGAGAAPVEVDFRFPRYQEVLDDSAANISDHCPVRAVFDIA